MGQGDHRNHREAAVSAQTRIVSDRSTTGGEFHHRSEVTVDDGEVVVRGQLLVDRLVVNEVRPYLPGGTRPLPPSDLGRERLSRLIDWTTEEKGRQEPSAV